MVFLSDSEKIVDNVLSGEIESYGVILSIIGFLIIGGTLFTRISLGYHINKAFDGIKNLDNIDMLPENETEKNPQNKNKNSTENKKPTEKVEEKPKTNSENIKNETSTKNAEKENKNTTTQNKKSKPKDYRRIGKNIKSALNPTKIKIKNNTETTPKTKPKKEKIKKETEETTNTSVSFDDAMDSIDDLMDDTEN